MFVGDQNRFAIEFLVQEPRVEEWLFGKICYRLGGQTIGDYELGGTLNGAVGAFIELLRYKGMRRETHLMGMSADESYRIIDSRLYGDSGKSMEQIKADRRYYWRFHAKPVGFDVFDGWKCYLIEDDEVGRFLWKDLRSGPEAPISEFILSSGEFDSVLISFILHMHESYPESGGREDYYRLGAEGHP